MGFNTSTIYAIGTVVMPIIIIGSIPMTNFIVIDVLVHYNVIWEGFGYIRCVVILSTYHQVIKYPIEKGIR